MLIVLTTAPSLPEAEALAQKIIEAKLAACVQISAPIISYYIWKDELQKDSEHQLFIKTLPERLTELESFIKANHSYMTPEIIAIKAEQASEDYLKWTEDALSL